MAAREQTYIMIKPDGVQRGIIGDIIGRFEKKGFKLVAMKLATPSKEHLEKHYADLSKKKFFPSLIEYMLMGPVCCMVWEGANAIKTGRVMLGATNPKDSAPGTIRGDLCIDVGRNICHGSDCVAAAKAEIALWFPEGLNYYADHADGWVYENGPKQAVLLGMGNPLLDVSANVPQEYMDKYGVAAGAQLLAEEKHMPIYEELPRDFDVAYIAGGATQNSIRVCQALLGPKDDGATAFIGCVGKDANGQTLKTACEGAGVQQYYMESEDTKTGVCAVLIRDKERALVTDLQAANKYNVSHTEGKQVSAVIDAAQFYYVSGYFLTVSPDTIVKVATASASSGKKFMLNLAAPFVCQFFKDPMMAAMPFCDVVIGNETEAEAFATTHGLADGKAETVALHIAGLPKEGAGSRLAIITQGSEFTCCAIDGKVTKFPVPALAKDSIVDTNGAGDAFVGGFLARYIKGAALEAAVEAGHKAARMVIQQSGCVLPAGASLE